MPYRLGLDLGTNSIGWCALSLDKEGVPCGVLATGVRLITPNQEAGRDPKSKVSLAADRRAARSTRRRRDRFLRRRERLMEVMIREGLMPSGEADRKALEHHNPYELRARAIHEALEPHLVGRALFHINQRRGFQSNRIAEGDDDGAVKAGIAQLKEALAKEGAATLGEFLYRRLGQEDENGKRRPVRFRPTAQGNKNLYDFYPSRAMTEDEIDTIWQAQCPHHPDIYTDDLLAELKRIIIQQRPLKKPIVGKCTFRPEEERAPRALPIFQRFRILQDLSSLLIEQPGKPVRKLTIAERDVLVEKLKTGTTVVPFEKLRKAIKLDDDARFNYESQERRKGFEPDMTAAKLGAKKAFDKAWRGFTLERQSEIVTRLMTEENEDVLLDWLERECGLSPERAEVVSKIRLPQGHSFLGASMLHDLVDAMKHERPHDPATGEILDCPLTYDQAIAKLGLHHSQFIADKRARMPYYGEALPRRVISKPDALEGSQDRIGRVPNPTVHIALNQMRRLVNALIDEYGPPAEIVIELARELKWNQKRKDEYNRELTENTRKNEARRDKLQSLGHDNNAENRLRLKLYEELPPDMRQCVYSGENISMEMLFSGEVEIDHILPFSKTLDDSFMNKVLCTRQANREKGNRAPADAYSGDKALKVQERAEMLFKEKAWRFKPDAMDRFEEMGGWQGRHLVDTQHMARLSKEYLATICEANKVWAVPGRLTAMLRGMWGLNAILPGHNQPEAAGKPKKDRGDHRHHAVDAFVVACTDRGLLQRMSTVAGRAEQSPSERMFGSDGIPEPWEGFRDDLAEKVRGIIVAHKLDHGRQGQLHEDTAYGRVDEEIDGKQFNLVVRKPISNLSEKEISQVRDPDWRARLMDLSERCKANKERLDHALAAFGAEHGLRRIRVLKTESDTITVRHGNGYEKAYVPGANHRMEIYQKKDGSWDFETVSLFHANQRGFRPAWQRNHPDASFLMALHKGDTLEADFGDGRQYWVIYRLNPASNRIWVAPHHDANDQSGRAWQRPSIASLKKAGAQLVRIDPLGRARPISGQGR